MPRHTRVITILLAAVLMPPVLLTPSAGRGHARVAIVFEHAGASLETLAPIYAMHQPFGLGIFPHLRYSARIVREAAERGLTPILHLPMEPRNPLDLGPVSGIVWLRMGDAEVARTVEDDLATTPGVVGISNHAGSLATADPRIMAGVLRVTKAHHLWFEENRTTEASVVTAVARRLGVRTVPITTYLDNPPVGIADKVRGLISTAKKQGWAIAAGHITTGAPQVVQRLLPEFQAAGIVFVPITDFLTSAPR